MNVRDLSIEKRQCRYPEERWPLDASLPYGFASCMIYTRVRIDLELCNCTLHFAPIECNVAYFIIIKLDFKFIFQIDKDRYCNYKQMGCISEHETRRLAREQHQNIKSCLSVCKEMHVDLVGYVF